MNIIVKEVIKKAIQLSCIPKNYEVIKCKSKLVIRKKDEAN